MAGLSPSKQSDFKANPGQIPTLAQREIAILNYFSSNRDCSIALLVQPPLYVPDEPSLYLVFRYYAYDLSSLMVTRSLEIDQARFYLFHVLRALNALHSAHFIHRDIKPENILIDLNNEVALTDFGLAREVSESLTSRVGTQYYRAPEQLLGDTKYGTPVDIWAVGCLMYVMMMGKPFPEGRSDSDQFHQICRVMGTPTDAEWPAMSELPNTSMFVVGIPIRRDIRQSLEDRFKDREPAVPSEYIDLMIKMLRWNPKDRITAEQALADPLLQGIEEIGPKLPFLMSQEDHQKRKRLMGCRNS
jgi:serine/threonine protein kinase